MRQGAHFRFFVVAAGAAVGFALLAPPAAAGTPKPDLSISKTKTGGYIGKD